MSNPTHTPEPWAADDEYDVEIWAQDPPKFIGRLDRADYGTISESFDRGKANAARIVACVNGCRGLNPEAVPEMLEALKEAGAVVCKLTETMMRIKGAAPIHAMRAAVEWRRIITKAERKDT